MAVEFTFVVVVVPSRIATVGLVSLVRPAMRLRARVRVCVCRYLSCSRHSTSTLSLGFGVPYFNTFFLKEPL